MLKKVLVTTDFSRIGNRAVEYAFNTLASEGITVFVCCVNEVVKIPSPLYAHYRPEHIPSKEELSELHQQTKDKLLDVIKTFNRDNADTEVIVVETDKHVHEEIIGLANNLKVDMIVMATHGMSGFTNLIVGSTTKEVLRKSNIPVLVIPHNHPSP